MTRPKVKRIVNSPIPLMYLDWLVKQGDLCIALQAYATLRLVYQKKSETGHIYGMENTEEKDRSV